MTTTDTARPTRADALAAVDEILRRLTNFIHDTTSETYDEYKRDREHLIAIIEALTPEPDQHAGAVEIACHITHNQIPALSDAICRGIDSLEAELFGLTDEEEIDGLGGDLIALIALRDDLQGQLNEALAAAADGSRTSTMTQCPSCDRQHCDLVCPYCGTEWDGRAR